jgi:RES domain-containing protein
VRLQAVFYRGHDPQWAFSPLSGDGAKAKGGRFNPIGVPALYLGATIDTVIVEMTQGFARRLEPLTMVSYDVDIEDIVDLRRGAGRRAAGIKSVDMACPLGTRSCQWARASVLARRESTAQDGCRHIGAFLRQGRSQGHAQSRSLEMGAGHSVSGYGARSERTTSEKSALLGIARGLTLG